MNGYLKWVCALIQYRILFSDINRLFIQLNELIHIEVVQFSDRCRGFMITPFETF